MPSHGPCQVMQGRGGLRRDSEVETTDGSFGQKECVDTIALYNREPRGCGGAAKCERKRMSEWRRSLQQKASTDGARSKVSKRKK
jgi:hypothetical protein